MTPLACEEARPLLAAYVDAELDAAGTLRLESHLAGCPACAAEAAGLRALRVHVRSAPYHRAPAGLREALALRLSAEVPEPPPVAATPPRRRAPAWSRWALPLAASLALAAGIDTWLALQRAQGALDGELIAGHVRSLQAGHLEDVASTDQHTVKPWFAGRLDYSPPVHDLGAQDFPLDGGRLDYLGGRNVAALVYRHRKHIINLYVWPAADGAGTASDTTRDGYNLVAWSAGGMHWCAVSDVNAAELRQFAVLLRTEDGG